MKIALWCFILAVICLCAAGAAFSRDGWQGRPLVCDPAQMGGPRLTLCQQWLSAVRQPDNRAVSCCGDGDAFIADEFETIGGNLFAIITETYSAQSDDYPGGREIKKGSRILIPPNKINRAREDGGNPSSHGIVFISPGTGEVLCYFGPTLS